MKKMVRLYLFLVIFLTMGGPLKGQESSDFYVVDDIQRISIEFEQENWRYILDSLRFNGEEMLLGTVTINGKTFQDAGVRYRVDRAFEPGRKRNGLYLQLDFINRAQNYQGTSSILLSSALRDPSMIREVLGYEIARQYMPAPRANFADVSVNDEYYGLLVNVETVDEPFLNRHYGDAEGSLFLSQPNTKDGVPKGCRSRVYGSLQMDNGAKCFLHNYRMLSEDGWDDLIHLTTVLNDAPDQLEEVLDIDHTLWMLAFNNITVNLSSYIGQNSPNYYLYKDQQGQFHPLLWDLNLAFGSFKNTGQGSDLKKPELVQLSPLLHADNGEKPLVSQLLDNDLYRKIYLSHLRTLLYEQFDSGRFTTRARDFHEQIRESMRRDSNQYYTVAEFDSSLENTIGKRSKIPGLVNLMEKRVKYLKRHSAMTIIPPGFSEMELAQREKFSSQRITSFKIQTKVDHFPKRVQIHYRFDEEAPYRQSNMYDDGNHNDGKANDGVYGIEIQPEPGQSRLQFYFFAENARSVNFEPTRYMYAPHEVTLEELNR